MKWWKWIIIAVVVVLGAAGYYLYAENQRLKKNNQVLIEKTEHPIRGMLDRALNPK